MSHAGDDCIDGVGRIAFRENPSAAARLKHSALRLDPIELRGIHSLEGCDTKQRGHFYQTPK